MSLLSVANVNFTYPQSEKKALSNVSVIVERGEYVALVGTNGSGKSTLARLIAGFIKPDQPTASHEVPPQVTLEAGVLPGIVFQQPKEQIVAGVVSRDTAFGPQNLAMTDAEIELRTMECLSVTGLLDRASSRTFELSLGQTQRLAFSGILALFPDLLILDEVTAMLDPSSREEILSLMDEWNKKGHTIIHVTHDKDEMLRAGRVVMLDKGQIVFDGRQSLFIKKKTLVQSLFGDGDWYKINKRNIKKSSFIKLPTVLDVQQLSFSYPNHAVFDAIHFSLKKGTLTALTGPSGCGKSTLFECIAGLLSPTSGFIRSSMRPSLALQESESALFEQFAADDVAFGPRNQNLTGRMLLSRVQNAMNVVGLPYNEFGERQTFALSGGEKRKLSLAGIIALDSEIMLFDEPTAGLDPIARETVMTTLQKLTEEGKTVLFSTHRRDEAEFADVEITWTALTEKATGQFIPSDEQSTLPVCRALPNSEMITSLRRTENAFMAPPSIPNSMVQRLPAVLKYILFLGLFITSIAVRPLWLCGTLFCLCVVYALLSKYSIKKPLGAIVKLIPWLLVFALFQFIFFPAQKGERLFFEWGIFTISKSKIFMVLEMMIRTFSAVVCIGTFIFSTSEREILDGLNNLLKPLSILRIPVRYAVLVVGIIFRFIPLLLDEAAGVLKTQLVRGGLGKAHGFKKVKALLPLFVPLMIQTFKKAESFADALTARYFS
jgi:energy-coupling factor transport system ATP-binding protein